MGDKIISKPSTPEYEESYERIFGKKQENVLPIILIGFYHDCRRYAYRHNFYLNECRITTQIEQIMGYRDKKAYVLYGAEMLHDWEKIRDYCKTHNIILEYVV